ncbi:MAG: OmpA family protein [Pseudomonadota bacterium]
MKLSKAAGQLGLVALTIASPFAVAGGEDWYFGGNIGESNTEFDTDRIDSDLRASGFDLIGMHENDRDMGFKIYGGYRLNRYWSLEFGAFDLGHFSYIASTVPQGTLRGEIKIRGLNFDLVGFLPLTDKLSAFGRAGLNYARSEVGMTATGAVNALDPTQESEDPNLKFGLGAQYEFNRSFAMRLEAERYRIDDIVGDGGDIDLFSLGFVVSFGGEPPAPVVIAPPPPPPPPAAPPPPPVVVEAPRPPPVQTERYCSLLEFQFEINQHVVRPEEKEKLAVIGKFLQKYPNTLAEIEGHTDDVGTDASNQVLSQRRADAVVDYLVRNFAIAPARLMAVGYGESRPIADNSTEEGKRQNRRISAIVDCATDVEGLSVRPARATMALAIEFDGQDSTVKPEYRDELRGLADFLKANPRVTASVEGHTGNQQSTPAQALEMSQRRAQNVVNYLVENFGIDRSRLSAQGFGQTRRSAYNSTVEGQQDNRRVNVIINYPR